MGPSTANLIVLNTSLNFYPILIEDLKDFEKSIYE